jgi:hypothetical protein
VTSCVPGALKAASSAATMPRDDSCAGALLRQHRLRLNPVWAPVLMYSISVAPQPFALMQHDADRGVVEGV